MLSLLIVVVSLQCHWVDLVTLSIYLTLKGHSPICLMFLIIIIVLDHCLLCGIMIPMGWKNRYIPNWSNGIKPTNMTCLILPKSFMSTAKQTFRNSSQAALSLKTLSSQMVGCGWLALLLTKVGDVETNPGPITQTNKSMFAISAINKYMLGSRYP